MIRKIYYTVLCLLALMWAGAWEPVHGQKIYGTVQSVDGERLPYATVHISGTSKGTTTNETGLYELRLPEGEHDVVFQYIGYKAHIESVSVKADRSYPLDVVLEAESVHLQEVVVEAGAEDPAYAIIRKAIAKRDFYLRQIQTAQYRAYVKGLIKVLDAPESFLGAEIGDMAGILDTNRQGILYLSESESVVYFEQPDRYKEIMISSKVSGDDRGFSFNQATALDFNFYKNYERFGRKLVSPIADGALGVYRYRLIGAFLDEAGRLINKIKVIPKRPEAPAYFGHIYITEDLWNIQQVELRFTSDAVNERFFDTIGIRQVHIPIDDGAAWRIFSQVVDFNAHFFSFRFGGAFTYVYSDYALNPELTPGLFNNEILRVEEGANKRDSTYWADVRPIPLTTEEVRDYDKKDSLAILWESKDYLDSIDRKNNVFRPMNLLFGYTYNQSYYDRSFTYSAPLQTFQFNPVQGPSLALDLRYHQAYDEERKSYSIRPVLQYGFADKQFRPSLQFDWHMDAVHNTSLHVAGGRRLRQFNDRNPVPIGLNTWTSLFAKRNYLTLYDQRYAQIGMQRELFNGLSASLGVHYEQRRPETNHSDYSFFKKDRIYAPNAPVHNLDIEPLSQHEAFYVKVGLNLRFNQRYLSYPKQRFRAGSKYPKLDVEYTHAFKAAGGDVAYQKLRVNLWDRRLEVGRPGYMAFNLEGGFFLSKSAYSFVDVFHFLGNELVLLPLGSYQNGYKLLPYHAYSTDGNYGAFFWEHHFEGWLLDRLPLIKKTAWTAVLGFSNLYRGAGDHYWEWSFGIENIGIGPITLFRIDYVQSRGINGFKDHGFVIGLSQLFGNIL